jgi:hypothetical protein
MENKNLLYSDWIEKAKVLQKAVIVNDHGLILTLKRPANCPRPGPVVGIFPAVLSTKKILTAGKLIPVKATTVIF